MKEIKNCFVKLAVVIATTRQNLLNESETVLFHLSHLLWREVEETTKQHSLFLSLLLISSFSMTIASEACELLSSLLIDFVMSHIFGFFISDDSLFWEFPLSMTLQAFTAECFLMSSKADVFNISITLIQNQWWWKEHLRATRSSSTWGNSYLKWLRLGWKWNETT